MRRFGRECGCQAPARGVLGPAARITFRSQRGARGITAVREISRERRLPGCHLAAQEHQLRLIVHDSARESHLRTAIERSI